MEEQNMSRQERRAQKKEAQRQAQKAAQRKQSSKSALIWGGVVVVVLLVLVGVVRLASPGITTEQPTLLVGEVASTDHTYGSEDAAVTVIEYSDFQCPACRQYFPVVEELKSAYSEEQLQFVYRHYPLRTIHPHANLAAQASEAAANQGAFWEMHDLLFERQSDWSTGNGQKRTFIDYADELGLDVEQFTEDIDSKEVKDRVENGYRSAQQNGLTGTPSFFINGQRVQNPPGFEAFSALIDAELEQLGVATEDVPVVDEEETDEDAR